jgi:hypothetical protein
MGPTCGIVYLNLTVQLDFDHPRRAREADRVTEADIHDAVLEDK